MIPLRDENPTKTFSFVTIAFIAINVAVFVHQLLLPDAAAFKSFFARFALVPAQVTARLDWHTGSTVITSMFMHGGWLHIIGNMLYLWVFGNNIEDSTGHVRFCCFYLLCGIAAAAAQVFISADSNIPMVGASGAVSGVLGAYLILYPRARVLMLIPIWIFIRIVHVRAMYVIGFWFILQAVNGWLAMSQTDSGGVAWWAHIGGFLAGILLIPVFKKSRVRFFR
jgi:membrane associated rhomboid family serine protease